MNDTLCAAQRRAIRPAVSPTELSGPFHALATLRGRIAAWRERAYFRWELKRIARDNPHLIDDIGLTKRQVEDEIAKLPFWQR
ncbi:MULTISPECIES: DUF1127 domain-containing protein [unclassified Mesorhizobium]|jgi:uncharacterized protein YjiS (DUF1127 family)|uniref:DUF1127 domain-containing protein n=1 Tax=unclassified Mesorhizobium TaxID=325217 RepID=UPI000AED7D65|nr:MULTISPECIES: DUF1127 domain-containing protein [unclassified Mesorhizobium]MBN9253353.1 DUF1127 domain-containing protein [Mesorhizobium sp.]MBN9275237.1 DUF1127 domain-containing protein [Mesorhizobium sp.]